MAVRKHIVPLLGAVRTRDLTVEVVDGVGGRGHRAMQERLGHSDINITLGTYTHVVSEQHRRAGEQIDEVFGH